MADVPPDSQPSVFLCHNSQDKPKVRQLGDRLQANGVKPWIDECSLGAGCRWQKKLVEDMLQATAVVVCLGPNGLGEWQEHEIEIVVPERIKARKLVIPLALPTCNKDPDIPLWLSTAQALDLRLRTEEHDAFSRLLHAVDQRDAAGHYRPSIVILHNSQEGSSTETLQSTVSECLNALQRVTVIDHSQPLLSETLKKRLKHADLLVTLLAPDAFEPIPVDPFRKGWAGGAQEIAHECSVPVMQWRSDKMPLPQDTEAAFKTMDTETCLPSKLAIAVSESAELHFKKRIERARVQNASVLRSDNLGEQSGTGNSEEKKANALMAYPEESKRFVQEVRKGLKTANVSCHSHFEWELVLDFLKSPPLPLDAFVVTFTGDNKWLAKFAMASRSVLAMNQNLPTKRAFLHKADDELDADPLPFDIDGYREFYGVSGVPQLAAWIKSSGGDEP